MVLRQGRDNRHKEDAYRLTKRGCKNLNKFRRRGKNSKGSHKYHKMTQNKATQSMQNGRVRGGGGGGGGGGVPLTWQRLGQHNKEINRDT